MSKNQCVLFCSNSLLHEAKAIANHKHGGRGRRRGGREEWGEKGEWGEEGEWECGERRVGRRGGVGGEEGWGEGVAREEAGAEGGAGAGRGEEGGEGAEEREGKGRRGDNHPVHVVFWVKSL